LSEQCCLYDGCAGDFKYDFERKGFEEEYLYEVCGGVGLGHLQEQVAEQGCPYGGYFFNFEHDCERVGPEECEYECGDGQKGVLRLRVRGRGGAIRCL
jgi:hypothetical protein